MAKANYEKKVLKLPEGRLSYAYLAAPKAQKSDDGSPRDSTYETAVLLDPSNPAQAAAIAEIKADGARIARAVWGVEVPLKKLIWCFGNGDKKAIDEDGEANSSYESYKGMFYLNAKNTDKPLIGDRNGNVIGKDHAQFPYSGCYANVRVTLYHWHHVATNRRGVSADLRSIQFVRDGEAFGGNRNIDPDEEFEALGDAPGTTTAATTAADDWSD